MGGLVPPQVRRDPDAIGFWTAEEARRFLAFLEGSEDPYEALLGSIVELGLLTGMRRGEMLGLRWVDVDLAKRTLTVRQTRVGVGTEVIEGPPKTDQGRRTLALAEPHLALFARIRSDQDRYRALFGNRWVESGLVFTTTFGAGAHPDWVSQTFKRLVKASGEGTIRFHDLRHAHASLAPPTPPTMPPRRITKPVDHTGPGNAESPSGEGLRPAFSMVAGVGFEPTTFGL